MLRLLFDLETNGFLPTVTKIHCSVTVDIDTGEKKRYDPGTICYLMDDLAEADELWGHNIISYDLPVCKKLYPEKYNLIEKKHKHKEGKTIIDTMIVARVVWPDIKSMDFQNLATGMLVLPNEKKAKMALIGSHSLKAWGYRFGLYKGNYAQEEGFENYKPEMLVYCERDIDINLKLIKSIMKKYPGIETGDYPAFFRIEHLFYVYLEYQQMYGVKFDVDKAEYICQCWERMLERRVAEMKALVPDMVVTEEFIPKANNSKLGYVKGELFIKRKVVKFNPRSRQHITDFLINKYKWKPKSFTKPSKTYPDGQPEITYEILKNLPYREAPLLARITLLMDRIGLVKTEKKAWLKCVAEDDGRIHGGIIHNGTPTHRCRHFSPNLGNIISFKSLWGKVVRSWYIPEKGYCLLGTDFDAVEMRCLAEALWKYDNGAFYRMAFNGKKEDGTDPHSLNVIAIREELKEAGYENLCKYITRDKSKTGFYASLYGAWPRKLGTIVCEGTDVSPKYFSIIGEAVKKGLARNIKGLDELTKELETIYSGDKAAGNWPHLDMPDGRRVPVRKKSAILNSLLQTMGALLSKIASVRILEATRENTDWEIGIFWKPVLHVHDENQLEVKDENRERLTDFTNMVTECFGASGRELKFRVPIIGTPSVGYSWAETH